MVPAASPSSPSVRLTALLAPTSTIKTKIAKPMGPKSNDQVVKGILTKVPRPSKSAATVRAMDQTV